MHELFIRNMHMPQNCIYIIYTKRKSAGFPSFTFTMHVNESKTSLKITCKQIYSPNTLFLTTKV